MVSVSYFVASQTDRWKSFITDISDNRDVYDFGFGAIIGLSGMYYILYDCNSCIKRTELTHAYIIPFFYSYDYYFWHHIHPILPVSPLPDGCNCAVRVNHIYTPFH